MVDTYTKIALTIIAAALVTIAAQGFIERTRAADLQKVQICDPNACVNLSKIVTAFAGNSVENYALRVHAITP
jgi:hypothetical protein